MLECLRDWWKPVRLTGSSINPFRVTQIRSLLCIGGTQFNPVTVKEGTGCKKTKRVALPAGALMLAAVTSLGQMVCQAAGSRDVTGSRGLAQLIGHVTWMKRRLVIDCRFAASLCHWCFSRAFSIQCRDCKIKQICF